MQPVRKVEQLREKEVLEREEESTHIHKILQIKDPCVEQGRGDAAWRKRESTVEDKDGLCDSQ